MTASTTRKRRNPGTTTRSSSSAQSRSNGGRSRLPHLPRGTGNIIGVILLVLAAFVAGYLIGRAGPPVLAADESTLVASASAGDTVQLPEGNAVR